MEDVTIIIQGKILQECYDFYIENYKNYKVIISTWVGSNIDFSNIPHNFSLIQHTIPEVKGPQHTNWQLLSTLNGLKFATTKYVIKIRGDEYYSNFESVAHFIKKNDNKIYTSPIWFRHWSFEKYHASDHIVAGTKDKVTLFFQSAKDSFDKNQFETYYPEILFTKSYLKVVEPYRFENIDGRILMLDHFEILDLVPMKPYRIEAKIYFTSFYNDFIPENNYSISNIHKLFDETPYKV